jgi:esterase/lipase
MQFGKNDIRVTEKEREDLYKNTTAPKRLVLYENSTHESLCKKENEKWVTNVSAFLMQ